MTKIIDPVFRQQLESTCGLYDGQIRSLIVANVLSPKDLRLFKTEEELLKTIGYDCNIVTIRKMTQIFNLDLKSELDCQSKIINTTNFVFPFWHTVSAVVAGVLIADILMSIWHLIFNKI